MGYIYALSRATKIPVPALIPRRINIAIIVWYLTPWAALISGGVALAMWRI